MDTLSERLHQIITETHELMQWNGLSTHADFASSTNLAFDRVVDALMDMVHTTQDLRREYNANVRIERHQERLARQREQSEIRRREEEQWAVVVVPVAEPVVIPKIPPPLSKVIRKRDLDVVMGDDCGICLDKETRRNTVSTCCGHHYCKTCFDALVESCREVRVLKCPICRKENPRITLFRARNPPTKKPVVVPPSLPAEENTDVNV